MNARTMTIKDHHEIETEGWRSPAQLNIAASVDERIAQLERLLQIQRDIRRTEAHLATLRLEFNKAAGIDQ